MHKRSPTLRHEHLQYRAKPYCPNAITGTLVCCWGFIPWQPWHDIPLSYFILTPSQPVCSSILIMPSAWLGSDKCQFLTCVLVWVGLKGGNWTLLDYKGHAQDWLSYVTFVGLRRSCPRLTFLCDLRWITKVMPKIDFPKWPLLDYKGHAQDWLSYVTFVGLQRSCPRLIFLSDLISCLIFNITVCRFD